MEEGKEQFAKLIALLCFVLCLFLCLFGLKFNSLFAHVYTCFQLIKGESEE